MMPIATLAASALAAVVASGAGVRDGAVKAVSVTPAAGRVEVVIDLQGAADVRDFTLAGPDRVVIDLVGARLDAPGVAYDGQNRGGVRNVRYGQYQADVVRVVIDLDAPVDYEILRESGRVRVALGTAGPGFVAWTSERAPAAPATAPGAVAAPAVTGLEPAARVTTPQETLRPVSVDAYLASHARESAQSQAPRITVTWDRANIEEVVAGFAAFSGRTIVLGKGITGTVTAEIRNQPWDLAFNALLESQGLAYRVLPGGIINVQDKKTLAASDSTVPLETRLVRVNYANAGQLVDAVRSIVTKPRGAVVADSTSNSLVITEVATRIDEVEQFVRGMDQRTPQVSIQAKIIFVDRSARPPSSTTAWWRGPTPTTPATSSRSPRRSSTWAAISCRRSATPRRGFSAPPSTWRSRPRWGTSTSRSSCRRCSAWSWRTSRRCPRSPRWTIGRRRSSSVIACRSA